MGKQYVIFEIDSGKFGYEFVRACYKIAGEGVKVKPLVGAFCGLMNNSYICTREMYEKYIIPSTCVDMQECVIILEKDKSGLDLSWQANPLDLEDNRWMGTARTYPDNSKSPVNWTYDPSNMVYWIVTEGEYHG